MFNRDKFITRGVQSEVPVWIQEFMWQSIDKMDVVTKDYLQVFRLIQSGLPGIAVQKIIHSQEVPKYMKEYYFPGAADIIESRIFVIDDNTHSTMLLADEY